MQLPITIGLHRSRLIDGVLLVVALTASCTALAFPVATAVQAGLLLAIGGLTLDAARRLAPSLAAVHLESGGNIRATRVGDGEPRAAVLCPPATVNPWLTVFRLCLDDGSQHTVLVARDSATADDFRRLRVFLRWRAAFSVADDSRAAPYS